MAAPVNGRNMNPGVYIDQNFQLRDPELQRQNPRLFGEVQQQLNRMHQRQQGINPNTATVISRRQG